MKPPNGTPQAEEAFPQASVKDLDSPIPPLTDLQNLRRLIGAVGLIRTREIIREIEIEFCGGVTTVPIQPLRLVEVPHQVTQKCSHPPAIRRNLYVDGKWLSWCDLCRCCSDDGRLHWTEEKVTEEKVTEGQEALQVKRSGRGSKRPRNSRRIQVATRRTSL
jgi:hypothetical protein